VFGGFRFDHSSFPVDPRALDSASHVTGGDTNSWIVADALYFSSIGISANEQFSVLFDEPHWGANRRSSLPVCFDADVFLACELGQFVSLRTQRRLFTIDVVLRERRWCFPHQPE